MSLSAWMVVGSRRRAASGTTATARSEILAAAEAKDAANQRKEADHEYHKLAYPPPPFVDGWLIAHCQEHCIPLVVLLLILGF